MSNIVSYKDKMAFHPGYYVEEIIEEMEITQAEFAVRMDTTAKTLSQLISGKISLSNDLAKKLSVMMGSSVEFWLNLQKSFDEKIIELKKEQEFDEQAEIVSLIDYSFFKKIGNLPSATRVRDKVANLCAYLNIASLRVLVQDDFLVNYRTGITSVEEKNLINAKAWLQAALNISKTLETKPFNAETLKSYLSEIRSMTLQQPEVFIPRLEEIFAECGVAFVMLPYLKNSGINGAVKWVSADRVVLAMNNRRLSADTFWFSLFHEIKHVLQQKIKTVFINSTEDEIRSINEKLESEADEFAQNYLIPKKEYIEFIDMMNLGRSAIINFAKTIGIHPGVVVGRMQHDGILLPSFYSDLKQKYEIII